MRVLHRCPSADSKLLKLYELTNISEWFQRMWMEDPTYVVFSNTCLNIQYKPNSNIFLFMATCSMGSERRSFMDVRFDSWMVLWPDFIDRFVSS